MVLQNDNQSQINKLDRLYKELETEEDKKIEQLQEENKIDTEESLGFLMQEQEKKRRGRTLAAVAATLLVLAAASVAGIFYFNGQLNSPEEKIDFFVDGPQTAKIKERVTYKIIVSNSGAVKTVANKINLLKPAGFEIEKTTPEQTGNLWDIGDIAPFEKRTLEITGFFIDDISAPQTIRAILSFSPENFNSTFTIEKQFLVSLEPFEAFLHITAPENVSPGEKNKFSFSFGNPEHETSPMEKIKIKITPTADLQILTMNPKTQDNEPTWTIGKLNPGEKQQFSIDFTTRNDLDITDENREQKFLLEFFQGNTEDDFFPINKAETTITLINQEMLTYLIINGSSHDQTINLGDTLNCSLIYKNKSKKTFSDVTAKLIISTAPANLLDWSKISDKNLGGIKTSGTEKEITWTKNQVAAFKELKPDAEGMISFSIPIKVAGAFKESDKTTLTNGTIETRNTLNVKDSANNALFTVEGSKLSLALNTDLVFSNNAFFFYTDGTPIGSGSLPPKVGQPTKYKIIWTIKNTLHDLNNVIVAAALPSNVSMTTEQTKNVGTMEFDTKTKQAVWKIDNLSASADPAETAFFVELIPTSADAGKIVKLTENTTVSAIDAKTGATISLATTTLTTNLDADPYGKGFGVVQK